VQVIIEMEQLRYCM